VRYKIWK